MSSKEYSSEYYSEYYYGDSTSASESEYEYDYHYLEPSTTAPPPRAATDRQKRKLAHQISPSIKGTVDLWENRIAREGPNAIIAPLQVAQDPLVSAYLKSKRLLNHMANTEQLKDELQVEAPSVDLKSVDSDVFLHKQPPTVTDTTLQMLFARYAIQQLFV